MAAAGRGDVRVRLMFEYPPPAIPESCMFWILLDAQRCRVVTDLTCIIRQRFFYSQRGALSLYVDDCLLPPGESIRVIRDNDSIRVKWEDPCPEEATDNSPSQAHPPKKPKKRRRHRSEDENEVYAGSKPKKQKSLQSPTPKSDTEEKVTKTKKRRKKELNLDMNIDQSEELSECPKSVKKKKKEKQKEQSPIKKSRKSLPPPKPNCDPATKKRRQSSSSDSSTSSESDHKATTVLEKPSKTQDKPSANVSATKASMSSAGKNKRKKSSSSSSDSDTEHKDNAKQSVKEPAVAVPTLNGAPEKPQTKNASSSSDSSDSDSFVIKKSAAVSGVAVPPGGTNGHIAKVTSQQASQPNAGPMGRGFGRGQGIDNFPWRGQRGRGFRGRGDSVNQGRGRGDSVNQGRGRGDGNQFFYNYDKNTLKQQQVNEPATNSSIIIQNPPEAPKKDYSTFPLLAAPPQAGKIIAFKLLELTENYTPEVSDYKEGRILSYDPVSQQLELEILTHMKWKEPGKFDLVYENADGTDTVEYAVPQDCKITQAWSSLIEPRLVI